MAKKTPWEKSMPAKQYRFMSDIIAAPSPIGLEAAMTYGVLKPEFEKIKMRGWKCHQYRGNAGLVFDTAPNKKNALKVMVIGHADKIRLQVRSIGDDGKIWLNTDSFLPQVLVGHEVLLYCRNPKDASKMKCIKGGTLEAIGAIHFASPEMRTGKAGIKSDMIYLELQLTGKKRKEQVEDVGIRPGDTVILNRPIRKGFSKDTFYGAYLDNGIGCFVAMEVLRLLAADKGLKNVRYLAAMATHEEIGRFGSRVMAKDLEPDVVIAIDVAHDYDAAPGIGAKRYTPATIGEGYTLGSGSITSEYLNGVITKVAEDNNIPHQQAVTGRDTGTDGMAPFLASTDAAVATIGSPVRNMHTISECGHTGDVLASIHVIYETLKHMDSMNRGKGMTAGDLCDGHPRLDNAVG